MNVLRPALVTHKKDYHSCGIFRVGPSPPQSLVPVRANSSPLSSLIRPSSSQPVSKGFECCSWLNAREKPSCQGCYREEEESNQNDARAADIVLLIVDLLCHVTTLFSLSFSHFLFHLQKRIYCGTSNNSCFSFLSPFSAVKKSGKSVAS